MTLVCGTAGFDGTQFKGLLASKYNIQVNKTSRNSVLLQSNINNTRSDVALLLRVLDRAERQTSTVASRRKRQRARLLCSRVKSLMTDVPDLPNFSSFHDAYRKDAGKRTNEGDIRSGFFAAYDASRCDYASS